MKKTLLLAASATFFACSNADIAYSADMVAKSAAASGPASAATPEYGYLLDLLYTGEAWDVPSGGLRRGGSYMENLDARFQVDTG